MACRRSGVRIPLAPPQVKGQFRIGWPLCPVQQQSTAAAAEAPRLIWSCRHRTPALRPPRPPGARRPGRRRKVAQPLERIAGGLVRDLGVDLHRDRDPAVPEDRHRHARVDVERCQQRPARSARVVNLDLPNPGLLAPGVEAALEVPRFEREAGASREQQPVPFAADADLRPGRGAAVGLDLRARFAARRARSGGSGRVSTLPSVFSCCLWVRGSPPARRAATPVRSPRRPRRCAVVIDQARSLAPAQAQHEDEHPQRVQRVTVAPGRFEEPACLVHRP